MARKIWKIDEATRSIDLAGKTFIVTGANSGVGLETTRQLVRQGAQVVMACRRPNAAHAAAQSFDGLTGSYEVMELDLARLQSVRDFAAEFLAKHKRLDGMACNAGLVVMGKQAQYTIDNLEETIAVSYFGHFLLTELLLDVLKQSAPSRVVLLSSVVHAGSPKNRPAVDLDDINYQKRPYSAFRAYAEAKVAVVLYAMELAHRLKGSGVSAFSVHPGWARSNFGGNGVGMKIMRALLMPLMRSASDSNEDSAQSSLHCLLSDDAPKHSGGYFSQSSVLYRDAECKDGGWPLASPNPNATDMDAAQKLVALSREIVKL